MVRPLFALVFGALLLASVAHTAAPAAGATAGAADPSAAVDRDCAAGGGQVSSGGTDANLSVTTLVAPGADYDRLRNASALAAAADAGRLASATLDRYRTYPPNDVVDETSVVVHRVELRGNATRLLDRLAAQNRSSPTANFVALARTDGVDFRYSGPTACPPRLVLNRTVERGALRVVPDREHGVLYVLADVDRLLFELGDGAEDERWAFGYHEMSLELGPESGVVDTTVRVDDDYEVTEPSATFTRTGENVRLSLDAEPNRTVGGVTTLAPGTAVTVRLTLANGTTRTRTASVHAHPDGPAVYRHYHASVDLSGVPEGTEFGVSVTRGDLEVGEASGEVVTRSASVRLPDRERWDDGEVVVENVTLSDGGFVRVTAGGSYTLGHSDYLSPGPHEDVVVPIDTDVLPRLADDVTGTVVAYVHADTDADGEFDREGGEYDRLYVDDGRVVSATAPIVATGTLTPTAGPSGDASDSTPSGTTGPPTVTPGTSATDPPETPTTTPGFGVLIAVLALCVALFAGARRW